MMVDKFPDNEIKRRPKDMNPDNKTNQISMLKYNKDFTISTENTRTTKKWKNSSTTVAEFVKILSEPFITKETYDEYMLLPKDEQDYLKDQGKKLDETTIAVQGFGNAGAYFASIASEAGMKVVAVSDSSGGVFCNGDQCEVPKLKEYKEETGSLRGNFCQGDNCDIEKMKKAEVEMISNEELLALDVDVLVLAALDGAVHEGNADTVKAKAILELANGPVTPEADEILEAKAITVIPDILANAGGVTVSYFEWVQNRSGDVWTEAHVNERLEKVMQNAYKDLKDIKSENDGVSLRTAALMLGIERLITAMKLRGWL
jgi:glutamate dehydrogenase (NADP+)